MNIDAEILNKILEDSFQKRVKRIINYDSVQFVPSMQGWFNIKKSTNLICHLNGLNKNYHIKRRKKNNEKNPILNLM